MIELRGVQLRCSGAAGQRLLFDGVDLDLAAGDVACVTGASGAGKSTLLRLLYGAVTADEGRVRVFGHDVRRLRRSSIALLRRRVGIVTQDLQLFEDRTALANVAVALEVRGERPRHARKTAAELLVEVGLSDYARTRVGELSRGQAQRVAIARAIAGKPALLLLDDPTSHQDEEGRELVAQLVDRHGGLITTNDTALLERASLRGWRRFELADGLLALMDGFALTIDEAPSASQSVAVVDDPIRGGDTEPMEDAVPVDPFADDELEIEVTVTAVEETETSDEAAASSDAAATDESQSTTPADDRDNVVVPFPRRSAGGAP